MSIITVQVRLVGQSRSEVEHAISALREAVGAARLAISPPQPGRDTEGSGQPPWLAYGTFQCALLPPHSPSPTPSLAPPVRPRRRLR